MRKPRRRRTDAILPRQHRHYCGIDLHVKTMYVCILDGAGQVLVHRNVPSRIQTYIVFTCKSIPQ